MTTSGVENARTFLQCPFCASADDWIIEICEPFDAGHIAHIHCTHCGAAGPSGYSATSDDDAIELARRGWRLRAAMLDAIDCRTCKHFTTKAAGARAWCGAWTAADTSRMCDFSIGTVRVSDE